MTRLPRLIETSFGVMPSARMTSVALPGWEGDMALLHVASASMSGDDANRRLMGVNCTIVGRRGERAAPSAMPLKKDVRPAGFEVVLR